MGSDEDKNKNDDNHNTVLYIQMGACVLLIASRYALHLLGEHQAMADVIVGGGILAKDIYSNFLHKAEESDKKAADAFTKSHKKEVVGLIKAVVADETNLASFLELIRDTNKSLNEEALKEVIDANDDTDDKKAARELLKTLIENVRALRKSLGESKDEKVKENYTEHTKTVQLSDDQTSVKAILENMAKKLKEDNDENKKAVSNAITEWIKQKSNQGRSAQAFRSGQWQDIVAMLLNIAVLGSGALDLAKVKPFHQSGKGRSRSRRQRGGKKRSRSSKRSRSKSRRRRRSKKH